MSKAYQPLILLLSLVFAIAGVAADPPALQGPTFLPGNGGQDESSGDQEQVDIAAGGGGFLTVWTDRRTALADGYPDEGSGRDVYAARLDADGNLIDAVPLIVSQDAGSQQEPEVAWNGQNWLVIWENQTMSQTGGAPPRKIFAARVAPDGSVLDDPPFLVLETVDHAGAMTQMAVVANGSDWLVVGQADTGAGLQGVRVAADGTVVDPVPAVLAPGSYFLYSDVSLHVAQGEYLLVYDASGPFEARRFTSDLTPIGGPIPLPNSEPRVASNGTDYFVTWDPSGLTLFGSRMTLDGTLLDPAGIPVMESFWDPITLTRVTWDGANWWVVHALPYPGGGLRVTRVSPGGTVLDSPPIQVFNPADEEFVGTFDVASGPTGGLQFAWADQDCDCPDEWDTSLDPWDIHGAHVSAAGQVGAETALSRGAPAQLYPDLVAGPSHFLAVFRSESAEVKRIFAQRLDTQGNAIDAEPIEIASSAYVTNPAAAWNGSVYMIVWDEFYQCVGGDPGPCGSFIQAVRMLPDGTVIDPQPITIMTGNHADVAALGDTFLVVGRDNFIFFEHEVVPLGVRVDGTTGTVLDTTPLLLGWSFAVHPRVVAHGDRWLVVFERRASHDQSWGGSHYNFVAADGTVEYDKFETRGACAGATPEVAVSGAGAMVVCREGAPGHFLNDINGAIILPDDTTGPSFQISGAVEEQRGPHVTWTGTEFLAVWADKRNGIAFFDERTDLYGARIDVYGNVLDPDGFPIATGGVPEQHAALARDGADILMAAAIFRDDSSNSNFRLGVYHTPGTVNNPPDPAFTESTTGGCSPLAVSFTDQSVGDASTWFWSFGDGTTSFDQNPTHVYLEPGTYSVFLTAGGDSGPASHVKSELVTVAQGTVADFWTPVTSGCAPLDVSFYNTSLGDQTGWTWMFGDDTVSNLQIPVHTYEFPGTYSVMMTADGSCGPNSMTKVGYIEIDRMCPLQDGAVADTPVEGVVTGTYVDTHVDPNPGNYQSIQEVAVPVEGGMSWQLEHRWRFDATGGTAGMSFFVDFYIYWEAQEGFLFEYSLDNVNFTPLVTITDDWSSQHLVPLPPDLKGTVWIRLTDDNRTITDTRRDWTAVYGMAIETGVPTPYHAVQATMGLQFTDPSTMEWIPAASATRHDVEWGNLANLRTNGTVGDAQCGWEDTPGSTLVEPANPPSGVGYYYIIRGDAPQLQAGTFDNAPGLTVPEGRDQEIGTAGGATCGDMP